jgi:hypothetical protein
VGGRVKLTEEPLSSVYVRPGEDDPGMDARVKQGRTRDFIRSKALAPDPAIAELEERKRSKGHRQTAGARRVVAAVPPIGAGVDEDNLQAGDNLSFEGWRIVAERALAPEMVEVEDVFF